MRDMVFICFPLSTAIRDGTNDRKTPIWYDVHTISKGMNVKPGYLRTRDGGRGEPGPYEGRKMEVQDDKGSREIHI